MMTRKYSGVRKSTLGLSGGKELIAIIRASGSIRRIQSPLSARSSGIIGEKLIGKIRKVRGKFNLGKLSEKIGFNKEIISKGRYAELHAAEQRSLRLDEAELFSKSAQHAYKQFQDKAALSKSMTTRWKRLHKEGLGLVRTQLLTVWLMLLVAFLELLP
eukprot:XP_014630890.1 serine protease SPPA, chloroplastic-like isoform X3 [Glycine max]